jgi:tetratricopeptide (TPR) repeat protein
MWVRFVEFSALFAVYVAAAFLYFAPQIDPRWRPAPKYAMWTLVFVAALSEFLVKDLTGKGLEDRAAHLAGYAFCAVIPQFSPCYDRAIAEFGEAIREDPYNAVVFVARANAYFGHGDFDRAIADFDEALRLNPVLAAAYAGRAYAYRAKGKDDLAVSDIQQASKLDPQFALVGSEMVRAVAAPAFKEAAEKQKMELERRSRLEALAALLTRARTYLSAGDVAAARLTLRMAAERDDPQAALALGGTYDPAVLRRLGIINFHADPAQAREWYRRAAELGSPDASLRLDQLVQTEAKSEPPAPVWDLRKSNARRP